MDYSTNSIRSLFHQIFLRCSSKELYNQHQTDRKRLRGAWNFVTQLNEYVSEIGDTPRYPLETLLMGGGDCEDSAILLGSILYAMPTDWDIEFVFMDIDNPTNPQNINHVLIGVDTSDGYELIETTSDTTMTAFDKVNGFFVKVEPTGDYARNA